MSKKKKSCKNFGQIIPAATLIILGLVIIPTQARTPGAVSNKLTLDQLNPNKVISHRGPGSYIPSDEITPLPFEQKIFLNQILVEDDAGVLSSVRSNLRGWEEREQYAKDWNLQSTGLYDVPDIGARKSYLNKKLIKYLDKRLSGEVKKAEAGSTLHQVGQVQKALRPNAEASITKRIKIKFRAKILQAQGTLKIDNPWIEANTQFDAKGNIDVNMAKSIKSLGIHTSVNYQVDQGQWVAAVDRPLNDHLVARVSSAQSDKHMAFSEQTNRTVELIFNKSF